MQKRLANKITMSVRAGMLVPLSAFQQIERFSRNLVQTFCLSRIPIFFFFNFLQLITLGMRE